MDQIIFRIIFAWWGAEENGLVGSEYYANQLVEQGIIKNIACKIFFFFFLKICFFF